MSFPTYQNENVNEAIDGTYIFGKLQLGPDLYRNVLMFPSNVNTDLASSSEVLQVARFSSLVKHPIDQSVVLLPGLGNIARFHDAMASTTFILQLHQDDLLDRCFQSDHWSEYCKLLNNEPGGLALPVAAALPAASVADKGKKAPTKAVAVAEVAAFAPNPISCTHSDRFLIQRIQDEVCQSGSIRNHGSARFRLEQLLQQANDILTKFKKRKGDSTTSANHVVITEELMLEVRLEKPTNPEKWSLPNELSLKQALQSAKANRGKIERPRVVKKPPRCELFLTNGTFFSLTAELHRHLHENAKQIDSASPFPLQLTLASSTKQQRHEARNLDDEQLTVELQQNPFTRMIIVMKYDNDEALDHFNEGLNAINSRALPDIQGTIRSYSLTGAELEAVKSGKLDVISGFMVIDNDTRIIVIEGLAAPDKAMEWMYLDFLPKLKDNDEELSILVNPEVLFPERLYSTYCPDIKRIRVRGMLKKLARRPEIYNRLQVEEVCFQAVDSLMILKRAEYLKSSKALDIFPSSEALNKLELLYGEAITRSDMDGTLKREFVQSVQNHNDRKQLRSESFNEARLNVSSPNSVRNKKERKAFEFTDCRNPDFELHLRTRPQHRINFLHEQRQLRKQAWLDMLHRRDVRDKDLTKTIKSVLGLIDTSGKSNRRKSPSATSAREEESDDNQPLPKIFLYAGQRENFKEKAWNQLREKIGKDHNATYTFSKDFMSQNISAVDEAQVDKQQAKEERAAWLTQKGFQYPKPKSIKELLSHPKKPSNARIDELKEPFFDLTDKPPESISTKKNPEVVAREKDFRTQVKPVTLFGALEQPSFEYEFQLKFVGDRYRLPRGQLMNDNVTDPDYFRSVHLGGENQARIVQEALDKEKEEWKTKVIVDDIAFKVGKMNVRDRPIQSDKCSDILHDEPKRKELIHLRERLGHRNTSMAYTTAPLSILNSESFAPNAGQKLLARVADSSKFVTANLSDFQPDGSQKPKDFTRFINEGTNKPKIITMVAKRKHPPLDESERHGSKWDPA
jgi:hypothetical protein